MSIAFQQYGTNPELDKLVDSDNIEDRMKAAVQRYALEKIKNDNNENVRAVVAAQGFFLDELQYDSSIVVRLEVVYQGYNLDRFICRDKSCIVRDTAKYVLKKFKYNGGRAMINDIFEARMKYIEAYSELIRSELSYRLSAIRLKQVCEDISKGLGPDFLKELIEDMERCDEDE